MSRCSVVEHAISVSCHRPAHTKKVPFSVSTESLVGQTSGLPRKEKKQKAFGMKNENTEPLQRKERKPN